MMEKGEWMALLDPNLSTQHDESQVKRMALAAFLCTRRTPNLRPSMSKVGHQKYYQKMAMTFKFYLF